MIKVFKDVKLVAVHFSLETWVIWVEEFNIFIEIDKRFENFKVIILFTEIYHGDAFFGSFKDFWFLWDLSTSRVDFAVNPIMEVSRISASLHSVLFIFVL